VNRRHVRRPALTQSDGRAETAAPKLIDPTAVDGSPVHCGAVTGTRLARQMVAESVSDRRRTFEDLPHRVVTRGQRPSGRTDLAL